MADSKELQQIVERAVAQVLERQLPKLQAELVDRVLAELPAPAAAETPAQSGAGNLTQVNLVQAVASVHAGSTQKEILRALLDAGSAYGSRVALFVVKTGAAHGWQGRGFENDEAVKDLPLDMTSGPAAHAFQNRVVTPANIAEMDRRFVERLGGPQIPGPAQHFEHERVFYRHERGQVLLVVDYDARNPRDGGGANRLAQQRVYMLGLARGLQEVGSFK